MKAKHRLWFIIATNIQCEDRASRSLRAAGFRVYMPKMKKTIIHHRTKEPINRYFKLFNRYLFVSFPAAKDVHFGNARKCNGVETILGIDLDGKPCQIPRETVRRFMLAQRRGEFNDISPLSKKQSATKKFPLGSRLRVKIDHPFGGFYGQVTKIKGKGVVQASLQLFGRLVPVELDLNDIDAVFVNEGKKAA